MQLALSLSLFGFTFGACNDENPQVQTSKQELLASDNSSMIIIRGYETWQSRDSSGNVMSDTTTDDTAEIIDFHSSLGQSFSLDTMTPPLRTKRIDEEDNVLSVDLLPMGWPFVTTANESIRPIISLSENVVAIDSAGSVYITDRHNLTQDSTEIVWLSMVIDDTTINTSNENYPGSMVKEKIDQGMLPVLKHVKDRHWQVVFEFPSQNIPSTGNILRWVSPVESKLLDSLRANTPDYK